MNDKPYGADVEEEENGFGELFREDGIESVPSDEEPATPFSFELAKAGGSTLGRKTAMDRDPREKRSLEDEVRNEAEGWLTVDVYETPSDIVVESAVAGVNPNDLDVTATRDSITIKGERRRNKEVKDENYLYQECYWGKFSRSVILPQEIDPESASVAFKDGILTIRLPKTTQHKTRKLEVKAH